MIKFKAISLKDKKWIDPLLKAADFSGCHQNFGNLFAWSGMNQTRVSALNEHLVVKISIGHGAYAYFYPAGNGDVTAVIESMVADAADCGHSFILVGLSPENRTMLERLFPKRFVWQERRNDFDYIYSLDKMVSLSGKKLHAKRNHINVFKKTNEWRFELITPRNIKECWEMNEAWCRQQDCGKEPYLKQEYCATQKYFKYFSELGTQGGLIRANGKIAAYTIGEILNSDTYVIHIEKAFREIQGAYAMINREFAAWVKETYPHLLYINREEDVGDDGLRQAKLSYAPVRMAVKFRAFIAD